MKKEKRELTEQEKKDAIVGFVVLGVVGYICYKAGVNDGMHKTMMRHPEVTIWTL